MENWIRLSRHGGKTGDDENEENLDSDQFCFNEVSR